MCCANRGCHVESSGANRLDLPSRAVLSFRLSLQRAAYWTSYPSRFASRRDAMDNKNGMRPCFMKAPNGKPLDGPTVLLKDDRSGWSGSLAYLIVRFALEFDADGIWFVRRLNAICDPASLPLAVQNRFQPRPPMNLWMEPSRLDPVHHLTNHSKPQSRRS